MGQDVAQSSFLRRPFIYQFPVAWQDVFHLRKPLELADTIREDSDVAPICEIVHENAKGTR